MADADDDVLLVPSCQSFEFANGPRVKAAGVAGLRNFFPTGVIRPDGSFKVGGVAIVIPKSYFTLPKGWTNGNAANQTALALWAANNMTKAWYLRNADASKHVLLAKWKDNIHRVMRGIGGSFSTKAPHSIRSLAPYLEDWSWERKDCNR